jgi:hypothetical protein
MSNAKKIVFQGETGANSHMACRDVYPDYEAIPCATFEDCFSAMADGKADLAMIPIENSVAGRVADIHHLLPGSNLHIIGEYFMPIRFQLMAPKGDQARKSYNGTKPRSCAGAMPEHHSGAGFQRCCWRRHRRVCSSDCRAGRSDPCSTRSTDGRRYLRSRYTA